MILRIILCLLSFFLSVMGRAQPAGQGGDILPYFSDIRDTAGILQRIEAGQNLVLTYPDSSLAIYRQALQEATAADFPLGIILALQNISRVYADKGMYVKSLAVLREALPFCSRSKEAQQMLPMIYGGIATVYQFQNDYAKAAQYYYQSILLSEKTGSSYGMDYVYSNMAELLNLFGQPEQALRYLAKAEQIAMRRRHLHLLESILVNRGIVYLNQQKYDQAMEYFLNAVYIGDKYKLTYLQHFALLNLADIYLRRGWTQKAFSTFRKTYALPGTANEVNKNGASLLLGRILSMLGHYREAEDTLLYALRTAERLHAGRQTSMILSTLSDIYAVTGRYRQAWQYYRRYVAVKDSIANRQIADNINRLEIRYRVAEKDKELYQKQLFISQQKRRIERKNLLITGITMGTLALAALLLSLYRNRRHKQQIGQLKAMIKGEEKERNRIGRELHDGIGGMLTAVNMNLGAIQKRHQALPQMKELDTVTTMLQEMAAEIRKTSHNLMPDILLRHGFPEALRMYCEQVNSGNDVHVDLQCYGDLDGLDSSLAFSLYRILQELIQNIIKHADAGHAVIQIRQYESRLTISVEDDGRGFNTRQAREGAGLKNIRSRAQALYGHIAIESAEGRGTTVYIEFDLQKINSS